MVVQFGIAITGHSTDLTNPGYLVGSLDYMSPEQVSGGRATTRSDIYAVGVTLYELLTGRLPITGSTPYEVMVGHMQQIPPPPHEVAPGIPLTLSNAAMRAMAKDPEQRFATAQEFLEALGQGSGLLRQQPAPALPVTTPAVTASRPLHQAAVQATPSGSGFNTLPLEEVARKLAVYIGPVAKFVVKKLAAQSDSLDDIYREAAKQIDSDADRAAFLRSRRS